MLDSIRNSFKELEHMKCYEACRAETHFVEMRDGIKLETVIFFPENPIEGEMPSTFPVLLTRTPYDLYRPIEMIKGESFAKLGIVYAVQFCRGIGKSEGDWIPNENERNDGIDTLEWLENAPWCKCYGLHGLSYMALTCWCVADSLTSKAVGIFVSHYGVDRHMSAYEAGLFRHDILTGWTYENSGIPKREDFMEKYLEASAYRPHVRADRDVWGVDLPWYRQWIKEPDADGQYWKTGFWHMLRSMPEKLDRPAFVIAGWFDHHLKGTLLAYDLIRDEYKEKSSLVVGGWDHFYKPCVGGHSLNHVHINTNKTMFEWFHGLFKEEPLKATQSYYLIGGDKWISSDNALTGDGSIQFYFSEKREDDVRKLTEQADSNTSNITYTYDPQNPVSSIGGETLFISEKLRGCVEQPACDYREDVISFTTDAMSSDINISGVIETHLSVASNCDDTCFTVKVMDVFPDGRTYNIRSAITTLAYRNGRTSRGTYTANTKVDIQIDCLPVGWMLKEGHRLRVDISSSNFPEYTAHSNKAGLWSEIEDFAIAHQKLYIGAGENSYIKIPVISI